MELIPAAKYQETPLYLLGTAGLRLVSEVEQRKLTSYLYEVLSTKHPFHLPQDSIGIISGKMEGVCVGGGGDVCVSMYLSVFCLGVFSWIAVNYLLGRFSSHHDGNGAILSSSSPP